jgi:hypothetical protein
MEEAKMTKLPTRSKKIAVHCAALTLLVLAYTAFAAEAIPTIDINKMNPDEMSTGPYSYFIPPYSYYYFHHMDKLGFKFDWVHRAGSVYPLQNPKGTYTTTYSYKNQTYTLDQYFERNAVLGFLVLKDNKIIAEQYFHGSNPGSRFLSNSVGKSITSTLFGIAVDEGKIASINDPIIKYVPTLKDSAFNRATLKDALEMATGIDAKEDASDPTSIVHQMDRSVIRGVPSFTQLLNSIKPDPKVKPGTTFKYVSMNTETLGLAIENATGKPFNKYLQEKIWSKIGAQSDAFLFRAKAQPDQCAFGCFNATLRDYGRFGLMIMNGGELGGTRVVSSSWVKEATTPADYSTPSDEGYGYQWWLPKDNKDVVEGMGVYGQKLYINPKEHVVIVEFSAWPTADDHERWSEASQVMDAITASLSHAK